MGHFCSRGAVADRKIRTAYRHRQKQRDSRRRVFCNSGLVGIAGRSASGATKARCESVCSQPVRVGVSA
jgi:hypothetical protein